MVVGQSGDLILAAKFHFLHTQMLAVNEQSKFLQTNAVSSTINFFFFSNRNQSLDLGKDKTSRNCLKRVL